MRKLLIVMYLATVSANSLGAISPHMDGEGCAMSCCKKARQAGRDAAPARLRCLVDCNQPASTSPTQGAQLTPAPKKQTTTSGWLAYRPETLSYIQHIRFPKSPTRFITGCSDRYLETGTFLI